MPNFEIADRSQNFLEQDLPFEPGEMLAEAEVQARTERKIAALAAGDVEAVGLVELALVSARRGVQEQNRLPRSHGLAMKFDLLANPAAEHVCRLIEAGRLFESGGAERRGERPALVDRELETSSNKQKPKQLQ